MKTLDFQQLPRETREALTAFAQGATNPRVHLHRAPGNLEARVAVAGGVVFVAYMIGSAMFRDFDPRLAQASVAVATALLTFAAFGGLARALRSPPYTLGRYVTAAGAFELHGQKLTLYDPSEFGRPKVETTTIRVRGTGASTQVTTELQLPVGGETWTWVWGDLGKEAKRVLAALQSDQAALHQALARGDMEAARALDPFLHCRMTGAWQSPQAPGGPQGRTPLPPALRAAQLLVALGLGFGGPALREVVERRDRVRREEGDVALAASDAAELARATAAFRARHPDLPMRQVIDALAATSAHPGVPIALTRPRYSAYALCGEDTTLCALSVGYQASLDDLRAQDDALRAVVDGFEQAFHRALPGTRDPTPVGVWFYETSNGSDMAVQATAVARAPSPAVAPRLRFRFTGAIAAGGHRVPFDYAWTAPEGTSAKHDAQLAEASRAFARDVIPALFGEAAPLAPAAPSVPAAALTPMVPGPPAGPLASLEPSSLGGWWCDRGSYTLRGGTAENPLNTVLEVRGRCEVTLEDMTLRGAYAYGVVRVADRGRLTLRRVRVENLTNGLALLVEQRARVEAAESSFLTQPGGTSVRLEGRSKLRAEGSRFTGAVDPRDRAAVDNVAGNTGLP